MNLIKKLWNLLISEKIYEIYENFCPSKARFPFLLEARRAEHERGQSEPRQSGPVRICQFVHSIFRFFDDI